MPITFEYEGETLKVGQLFSQKNAKIEKSNKSAKYYTLILHLAPHKVSGKNVCSSASKGCAAACLNTAGFGRYGYTQRARIRKTKLWHHNRPQFIEQLIKEIKRAKLRADKMGKRLAIRLNGTSDIVWERVAPQVFTSNPNVIFYDYTKHYKRCLPDYKLPPNYQLIFSRSEVNEAEVEKVIAGGRVNVAVVFDKRPKVWYNRKVHNGDRHDMRFLDPKNCIVGLSPKGRAKHDNSGFVVKT